MKFSKVAALVVGTLLATAPVMTMAEGADNIRAEIERVFGTVPSYLQVYPESALAAGWSVIQETTFNEDAALDAKTRELIALAVAAQIPCNYCIRFHTEAATSMGATTEELREAIFTAAVTRHWSTMLYGNVYPMEDFEAELEAFFPNN